LNSDVHAGNRKNAESPFSLININTWLISMHKTQLNNLLHGSDHILSRYSHVLLVNFPHFSVTVRCSGCPHWRKRSSGSRHCSFCCSEKRPMQPPWLRCLGVGDAPWWDGGEWDKPSTLWGYNHQPVSGNIMEIAWDFIKEHKVLGLLERHQHEVTGHDDK
jgi:hypothetical protein